MKVWILTKSLFETDTTNLRCEFDYDELHSNKIYWITYA